MTNCKEDSEREYIVRERLIEIDEKGIRHCVCVEVGELIRCKDCKHNYANMIPADPECCLHVDLPITDDFYCAKGERIDDETD